MQYFSYCQTDLHIGSKKVYACETLTLSEYIHVEQLGGLTSSLHFTGSCGGVVRSSPEHPSLTEALGIDASSCRSQHYSPLQEGQQFPKTFQTCGKAGVGDHVWGGVWERDSMEAGAVQRRWRRRDRWRRQVSNSNIIALYFSPQNLLTNVVHGYVERVQHWKNKSVLRNHLPIAWLNKKKLRYQICSNQ